MNENTLRDLISDALGKATRAPKTGAAPAAPPSSLLTNIFANMALQGSALGSVGRIGMSGLAGTGALGPGLAGVNPWVQMGIEVAKLPGQLRDMGAALVENQRHLSAYSGTIATSMAQLDVHRIQRDIKTAGENEQSVKYVAEQTNKLEDALRPMSSALDRLGNYVVGGLEGVAADIVDSLTPDALQRHDDRTNPNAASSVGMATMIELDAAFWFQMQRRVADFRQINRPIKEIWNQVE